MNTQAEELLNSLSTKFEESHIVIENNRFITVPSSLRRIAVQYDHNIETVTFDCPRYWDGLDMSKMKIYINYMLPDRTAGSYIADNITIDSSDNTIMHFDWTISRNVTMKIGNISFLVCIKKTDDDGNEVNHWNSELNVDMYISEGLECKEVITQQYADVITQLLTRMDNILAADTKIENMRADLTFDGFTETYKNNISTLFDKVKSDIDSNTLIFMVTTDNHLGIQTGSLNQDKYAKHYTYIAEQLGVDFQINLGDMIDEAETKGQEQTVNRDRLIKMVDSYSKSHIPFLYSIAHHEGYPFINNENGNAVFTFSKQKTLGIANRYNRYLNKHESDDGSSYYIDFPMQKIRFIVLDSCSYNPVGFSNSVSTFVETSLASVPNGYKVIFASHAPTRASVNWNGYSTDKGAEVETKIKNYVNNGGVILAYIHGHTHWDNIVKEDDLSFPFISVCCAKAQKMDTELYGTSKGVVGNPTSYNRSYDDISAYCADIFCVHSDTGIINIYRFGVGTDRVYTPQTI